MIFSHSTSTLEKEYAEWASERVLDGGQVKHIQYKLFKGPWFVVSGNYGAAGEDGFYVKGVRSGTGVNLMRILYKESDSAIPDEALTKMSRSFAVNESVGRSNLPS